MTDISESGIEAAVKAHNTRQDPTLYGMTVQDYGLQQHAREVVQMTAAIQAYLPFHPPASREEGLREALQYVASYAETRREHHAPDEVANAFDDIAKRARRALIPTKPEAKEPAIDLALIEATARKINPGRSEDHIKSVALDALTIFRALQSKKPE